MQDNKSPDQLLDLNIGSVLESLSESDDYHYSTIFVGVDYGRSVLTRLPPTRLLPEGDSYDSLFTKGRTFEMRVNHDGLILAFESSVMGIYSGRLLISSFPHTIESRRLRTAARYPCVLSCDMRYGLFESYGVISNISRGGCQIVVEKDTNPDFIQDGLKLGQEITLDVFFPLQEAPAEIAVVVRSADCTVDGDCKAGVAFAKNYECIDRYLESLQLDSVSRFFR